MSGSGDASTLGRSEEDLLSAVASTDSFWDIGNYRRVVKRTEDGARLCSEFVKMAQERADIEAKYARHLQQWARKWEDGVSKGPEYGSLEMGWKAVLKEANSIAELHLEIHRKIQEEIVESIQNWKASHYHKALMHLKEVKKADEGFVRAQKPWTKHLVKTRRAKKSFHQASRDLELQNFALQQAEGNPNSTGEQISKARERQERAQRDVDRALQKYEERLRELQHYKGRYVEDMTMQFDRCQEFENQRMDFFKDTLQALREALDLSQSERMMEIYGEYIASLSRISPEDDLKWYSVNFGTDMAYNWPEFEPYVEQNLTKSKRGTSTSQPSLSLINGSFPRHAKSFDTGSAHSSPALSTNRVYVGGARVERDEWLEPPPPMGGSQENSEEEDLSDDGEPEGKLMRALYDYSGSQEDDLHFTEGDLVRVMYEGDDGWAEGKLGDNYGYVPISYFEAI